MTIEQQLRKAELIERDLDGVKPSTAIVQVNAAKTKLEKLSDLIFPDGEVDWIDWRM